LFYHPKIGIWLGATPEQLLKVNAGVFETISLAGTQKIAYSNYLAEKRTGRTAICNGLYC
jgi:isochorismate synthase EntC